MTLFIGFWLHQSFTAAQAFLWRRTGASPAAVRRLLAALVSLVAGHVRFSCCGSWTPARRSNSCGARASWLCGLSEFPGSGIGPVTPALAGEFFNTEPAGKLQMMLTDSFLFLGMMFCVASCSPWLRRGCYLHFTDEETMMQKYNPASLLPPFLSRLSTPWQPDLTFKYADLIVSVPSLTSLAASPLSWEYNPTLCSGVQGPFLTWSLSIHPFLAIFLPAFLTHLLAMLDTCNLLKYV